jgi:acyl carrier protein
MSIQQTIIDFIKEKTNVDSVPLESNLLAQIKSFDFMMLILELEQKFSVQIPIEEASSDNLATVIKFANWVEQQSD